MVVIGWILYALFGVFSTFVALAGGQSWFALAIALCFIFGPKVWRSM